MKRIACIFMIMSVVAYEGYCQAWFMYQEAENYFYGINGRKQSYEKSFKLYEKAAKSGCVLAENRLATCYEFGYGVTVSERNAFKWHKRAARHGNPASQGSLGFYYFKKSRYRMADKWDLKAANNGNEHVINQMQQSFSRYSWGYNRENTHDSSGQEVDWYELFMKFK